MFIASYEERLDVFIQGLDKQRTKVLVAVYTILFEDRLQMWPQ